MSTSRSATRRSDIEGWVPAERLSEITGVILMATALMLAVSLLSHVPADPAWYFQGDDTAADRELDRPSGRVPVGSVPPGVRVGVLLARGVLFLSGWNRFCAGRSTRAPSKVIGLATLVTSFSTLLALALGEIPLGGQLVPAGGAFGQLLASYLVSLLNPIGAFILLVTLWFAALTVATHWSLSRGVKTLRSWQRHKANGLLAHSTTIVKAGGRRSFANASSKNTRNRHG